MFTQSTHPQYLMLMRDLIAKFQCQSGQSTLVIEQNGWWVTIQTAYVHTFHRPTHWIFWIPLIFGCVCHSYTSSYQQNSQLSQLTYSDSWHQTTSWFMAMWSNSWVCFFGAFLQWMSGFGLVACACSVVDLRIMLDEHPITARKSSEFTFRWEKKGKDLKDPMFIQVLDSFIVCYITRIYHPGENPSCLHCLGMFVEHSWVNSSVSRPVG